MNLKLRLKNKATLLALILAAVSFVYQVCGIIGIVPPVSEDSITQMIGAVLNVLVGLGVLVDPTTAGVTDSVQAMAYDSPRSDLDECHGDDGRDGTDLEGFDETTGKAE